MAQDDIAGGEGAAPVPLAPPSTWETPAQACGLFLRGATLRTGLRVSVFVGTILSVVNQGETIADGNATPATWVRVAVNYLVPFLVSSYGFLAARRRDGTVAARAGFPSERAGHRNVEDGGVP